MRRIDYQVSKNSVKNIFGEGILQKNGEGHVKLSENMGRAIWKTNIFNEIPPAHPTKNKWTLPNYRIIAKHYILTIWIGQFQDLL